MKDEISLLDTEQRNPRTLNISSLSSVEMVEKINYEDSLVPKLVLSKKHEIAKVIDLAYDCIKNKNGRLIYIGAGTSGRIGVLDASEIYPTYGVKNKVIGLIAGGYKALHTPLEGSEDNEEQAIKDLQKIDFNKNDILVGLSASGRTPYVVSGLKYAKQIAAKCVFVCNSINSPTSKWVDVAIEMETGPEAVTGSTRMKAGTSQKMVCNMISSSTMIKLGYVEENFMINLVPTNHKLEQRCINMIKEITHADDKDVEKIFKKTKNVKIALLMIKENLNYDEAVKKYKDIYGWN
ncbi:N-acetylmuramic acid 6-phosphate etherase [Mycoplasmopsis lipofaciens]|uniref:N-acetylmuramic acid 6-phosphate etherase n=1 Tax=Mycoplasmopsis lipofaciens TaxID=114884 RepID=UPI000486FBE8|nr:N-acetylmuramic acid 6-phosphate etherase [Mycoplasmopsis lipofaciens]